MIKSIRVSISFLLLVFAVKGTSTSDNETLSENIRQPRVNGRIVKLYSGSRPEPVYCSSEGFQPDAVNCAVFYRCVRGAHGKYTVFRYQCGPGTIYDPDTEVCNHPQNTKRSECMRIISNQRNQENEIYERKAELPSPITTKRQVYSDQTTKHVPMISTAYPWGITKSHYSDSASNMFTVYPWRTTPNESLLPEKNHQGSAQSGDKCTSDGFMGDSENCRKFYRCVGNLRGGFIRYEFSCSESTIWDEDSQSCNHAWAVQRRRCGRGNIESNNLNRSDQTKNNDLPQYTTNQQQLQLNYGSKISQVQTQISNGSVIQNQTQINYGDRLIQAQNPNLKQNQTQISYGSAVSQTQTQINYGNKGVQTQLQVDHTQQASQTQTQVHETNTKTTTVSIEQDKTSQGTQSNTESSNMEDGNVCTESGFMGDKRDCKKFYRCVDNGRGSYTKYQFSCGEGTVWDSSIEACNHAWAVNECGGKAPMQSTNQNELTTTTAKSTTTTLTQNYHSTSAPTTTDDDEDIPYGNQNQQQTSTDMPTSSTAVTSITSATSSMEASCTSSGFIGDSNDCSKFYRCVDNGGGSYTKYEFKCGEGTVWDSDIEGCNHVWAVKKCGGSSSNDFDKVETTISTTVSLTQITTQSSSHTDDYDTSYEHHPNEPEPTSTTTGQPQNEGLNEDNKCASSGFIGDKNDCKKFYRCVDNGNGSYTRYDFSCGEGTVWDSKIDACNHAWAVENCGSDNANINKETTSQANSILNDEDFTSENTVNNEKDTDNPVQTTTYSSTTTTISSNENTSENTCVKEGFIGDRNDCQKFYRCVNNQNAGYIKYEFRCGEGTVWDSEINSCNHANSVKTNCSTITSAQIENANESSQAPATEYTTQSTSMQSTNQPTESTSTNPTTESSSSQRPLYNNKCKSEGFYGDSNNCKKFYRCVDNGKGGYTKYDFSCGDGTVWDQEIQACNHESNNNNCSSASSDNIQSESQTENNENYISTTTGTAVQDTTQKTEAPQTISSDQCESEGFYANSKDCKKFFRCVDNGKGGYTKYDFTCGEGTIWVQDIQGCDHDNDISSCSHQTESIPQTSNAEQTTLMSPTTSDTMQTQSARPDKENDEYPDESSDKPVQTDGDQCSSEGFYGNKNDCRRFYRCVDNGNGGYTKYDFSCGEGTAWDSDIQSCNHINEVKSCENSNQQEENTKPLMQDEESPTSTSNTDTTKTTTSATSTESSKPENRDVCEQEGYYGNTQDCKKFYRCVDNGKGGFTKYDYTCGEGTIWDQDITTCNHPQDVSHPSCNQSDSNSPETSSSPSSGSTSQSSSSTTESSNNGDCSQENSSKPPSNQNVTCTKAGYYADASDCKKFYRCVDWDGDGKRFSVYHFDCGEGTIWDPALDTCNHEESVYPPRDCSGTQSQNENVDQESTTTEESTTIEETTTTTEGTTTSTEEDTTTTQQSTTTEQTTTQQSTTSEQTTTQQTTTSEQTTTQQSTITEQTTTQQTTTEQSTSSEQTTTQQPTTEQTTTQQSTSSEQTTTQQTTTEQTTTQQSTSSEQTTTQQTTTSEQTTQQTTTNEQTTAQQTTTEQSTTQQSTTDQTTTQQSTTTEETTTQQSSDQNTTTDESEESSTTEQSTTNVDETTTQESTTEQQSQTESQTEESTSTTDQQTEESSTTESAQENEQSPTESSSSSDKDCPETEDDQYLYVCPTSFKRHPKYCNLFYQCDEDDDNHEVKLAVFHCPNNTIYDESQTKCVEENKADKKCDGEIAQRRRVKRLNINYKEPIVASKETLKCPAVGYFPFEKGECSPAFLKCQKSTTGKLRGLVHLCPEGYLYWSVSKRCEAKSSVRFCNQSYNNWSGRWEFPIEIRNIAK